MKGLRADEVSEEWGKGGCSEGRLNEGRVKSGLKG